MANIKFYSDPEKKIQIYPEIEPNGIFPGVTVGLADNLISPDGIVDTSSFIYRTSDKTQNIDDGYAQLQKLIGATTSTTVNENITTNILATGVTSVSVNSTTFKSKISVSGTYNFIYTAGQWTLNSNNIVLSDYGITITGGTAATNDNIQIVYVAAQVGTITISNPTAIYSIGMNQFNINGNKILTGYTIDTSGNIVPAVNSYVIYFKCLGGNTYTIYNSAVSSTTRAAYSSIIPTTISTGLTVLTAVTTASFGQTVTNDSTHTYYQTASNGYMCIATTNTTNLCCHLTWSGYNDSVYESYFESTLSIPYIDENGVIISNYGIPYIDSTYYDELDFSNHKYYKRVSRIAYSSENLTTISGQTSHYIYDNNWIYYGTATVVYILNSSLSNAYKVSDFGTEEFLDTTLALTATIFYQNNLRDKLRNSVEVITNKVTSILSSSTDIQYPSAKAVYNVQNALRKILGIDTDTFSITSTYTVGSYVVYNNQLWKCTTAVTAAGAWTGTTNWTLSYLFTAS